MDTRSIADVQPHELTPYTHVHFFAGIGGWAEALRLAGWGDRPVWSGSCPCQPFSIAGEGKGEADERHLWPEFYRLIRQCKPPVVFGEQVASPAALRWLDGVSTDLEASGYAVGAGDLCAAGEGAPHIRQRLYWVAHAVGSQEHKELQGSPVHEGGRGAVEPGGCGVADGVGDSEGHHQRRDSLSGAHGEGEQAGGSGGTDRMGQSHLPGRLQGLPPPSPAGFRGSPIPAGGNAWGDYRVVHCLDGKARRIGTGIQPLAHGVPGRVGLLRGYGNAIVPQVAATFIKACLSTQTGL